MGPSLFMYKVLSILCDYSFISNSFSVYVLYLLQANTFQGILVTDLTTSSYAVFMYKCGDMAFSDPGQIGYVYYEDNVTHGASYREFPHLVSCLNEPTSSWVNIVYEIAQSG